LEQQQQRYTLGKSDKLKSTKAIEQLFKEGKSFSIFPFRVLYLEAPASGPLQTAFSVSKKHFKKAVDRNRIKRLMREAWRLQKNVLVNNKHKHLKIFIIYTGNELPEYELVFEKTTAIIKRVIKIYNEAGVSNT
jgi:ribonuclease P protein component